MIDKIFIVFSIILILGILSMILFNVANIFSLANFQNNSLKNFSIQTNLNLVYYFNFGIALFLFIPYILDLIISYLYPNKLMSILNILFIFLFIPIINLFSIFSNFSNVINPSLLAIMNNSFYQMFVFFMLIISTILNFRNNEG